MHHSRSSREVHPHLGHSVPFNVTDATLGISFRSFHYLSWAIPRWNKGRFTLGIALNMRLTLLAVAPLDADG